MPDDTTTDSSPEVKPWEQFKDSKPWEMFSQPAPSEGLSDFLRRPKLAPLPEGMAPPMAVGGIPNIPSSILASEKPETVGEEMRAFAASPFETIVHLPRLVDSPGLRIGIAGMLNAQGVPGGLSVPQPTRQITPEEAGEASKQVAGLVSGAEGLAEGLTSPVGVMTLGMGFLPKLAQRGISLAFAAQMIKDTPDLAKQLGTEFGKPEDQRDTQKIAELLTQFTGTAAFSSLAALHGLRPGERPPGQPGAVPTGADLKMPPGAVPPEKGVPRAREDRKATEVYGDMRAQPERGAEQVPPEGGSQGIQPQAKAGLPEAEGGKVLLKDPEPGKVRLYHGEGGAEGGGAGGSFFTTDQQRARSYGPNVSYIDVSPEEFAAGRSMAQKAGMPTSSDTLLPTELVQQAKPHPPIEQKIFDLEAESKGPAMAETVRKKLSEPKAQAAVAEKAGVKPAGVDNEGNWIFEADGEQFKVPLGTPIDAIKKAIPQPKEVTADEILKMSPDQVDAWIKKAKYGPEVSKKIASKLTIKDVARLVKERDKAKEEGGALFDQLKGPDDNETMRKAQKASLKAQTINEIIQDIPAVAEKIKGMLTDDREAAISELAKKPEAGAPTRVAQGLRARKIFDSETRLGGEDILSWISDNMPMLSKSQARASKGKEWWTRNQSLYDDAAPLQRPHHNIIYRGRSTPDQVAQAAYEAGKIKQPTEVELWKSIRKASETRSNAFKEARKQEAALKAEIDKQKDWLKAAQSGEERVEADKLAVGDQFEVEGERVKVTDIDPDTGEVTLEDGRRFGIQRLPSGQSIHVENYVEAPAEEAFALEKPESVEEQKARLAQEERKRIEDQRRQKMAEQAAKPLSGSTGDIGQGDLLGGGDLFSPGGAKGSPEGLTGLGGALREGEPTKPELAQLTDALRTMAQGQKKPQTQRAYTMGETVSRWKDKASVAMDGLKVAGAYAKMRLEGMPVWDSFKAALGRRQLALTESVMTAREFHDKALRGVPLAIDREGISNWIEHNGDETSIRDAMAKTKPEYRAGYQRALNLTDDQKIIAQNVQNYFESRLNQAIQAGVLEDGIENYIHRIYEKDSPWKKGMINELRQGIYVGKPGLARQRIFKLDADAEAAGYKPVKDFARRVAEYDLALNKAIADRRFVKEMLSWKMPDGRPAVDAAGVGTPIRGGAGGDEALLIRPSAKVGTGRVRPSAELGISKEESDKLNNRADYIAFDHPALRKWKWIDTDPNGKPTLIQGNVLVHPDALSRMKAVFGSSLLRKYAVGRLALGAGSTIKQTMLDISGFHPVQVTVHGWEHRVFKPIDKIDLEDPVQRKLISHGVVAADPRAYEMFSEGLSGSSLTRHIPGLGPKLQQWNHFIFEDYIPRLKMSMALHALERNRKVYSKALESGKMSEDQLYHLTANQANAAFGELNYEMMGRNKTFQDALRLGLLAPDFLEARAKFVGQAFTKYGSEQRRALFYGAAALYLTARILNKLLDGQYHFEPRNAFDVVYKGKAYSLRTVQGDLIRMAMEPMKFAYSRLNPLYGRTALEAVFGRDAFGRKRTGIEQLKDLAQTIVPISFRGALHPREQTLFESFLNAIGVTERRTTSADEIFKLAQTWKQKHGVSQPGEFIYDPEKDPYRNVKLALAYSTPKDAAAEIKNLLEKKTVTSKQLSDYFKRYGTVPFTGSKMHDRQFLQTLSDDQKKTYEKAIQERIRMRKAAAQAFEIFRQDYANSLPK